MRILDYHYLPMHHPIFLVVILIPAVAFVFQLNSTAKTAARKIDSLFKSFLDQQPQIQALEMVQKDDFLKIDYLRQWIQDIESLGFVHVCDKLEVFHDIQAIHNVWWNPEHKFFAICIANGSNEKLNARTCVCRANSGEVFSLIAGKGSMMSMPGLYVREYCERSIDTRGMMDQYASRLKTCGGSAVQSGGVEDYNQIRLDLDLIREEFKKRTNGVIPFEVLVGYGSKASPLLLKLIHFHIRRLNANP